MPHRHPRHGRPLHAAPPLAPVTDLADQEWRGRSAERAGVGIVAHHSEETLATPEQPVAER
ncbi:hypothetical protein [Streptomyces kronopolitis]|uniref:hypothetical protein n=1 Tax=Streptomyces kronopolitis TaxID=1612435 RepID=UPI00342C85B6